ncbi:hypothetical protein B0H13DRAFT_1855581 [Mycena leptocephala]|nr:hypothetical protein B0H13DRAFT_1855581 [Mycena leptocephala]
MPTRAGTVARFCDGVFLRIRCAGSNKEENALNWTDREGLFLNYFVLDSSWWPSVSVNLDGWVIHLPATIKEPMRHHESVTIHLCGRTNARADSRSHSLGNPDYVQGRRRTQRYAPNDAHWMGGKDRSHEFRADRTIALDSAHSSELGLPAMQGTDSGRLNPRLELSSRVTSRSGWNGFPQAPSLSLALPLPLALAIFAGTAFSLALSIFRGHFPAHGGRAQHSEIVNQSPPVDDPVARFEHGEQ